MRVAGSFFIFCIALFAKWQNAYSSGCSIVMPNDYIDYNKEFHKVYEEKNIYDESMKNRLIPIVQTEDRMQKKDKDKKDKIENYFYSTTKRYYYSKENKKYKKIPSIN